MTPDEFLNRAARVLNEAELQTDLQRMEQLTDIANVWVDIARCLMESVEQ